MKNKVYFILAIALALLGTFLIVEGYQKSLNRVEVVMAKRTIDARTQITQDMLEVKTISEVDKTPKMLTPDSISKIYGKTTTAIIYEGEPILLPRVGLEDNEGKVMTIKNENTREVSINLENPIISSPKLKKGDSIDIIANFKHDSALGADITKTILQQVEVIDVGQDAAGKSNAIVILHPENAEDLSFALNHAQKVDLNKVPPGSKIIQTFGMLPKLFFQKFNFIVQPAMIPSR